MTSYLQYISNKHGSEVMTRMKNYMSDQRKFAHMTARRAFLLKCRKMGIVPSHIINNVRCLYQTISKQSPFNREIDNMVRTFQNKILNMEIKVTYWEINQIKQRLYELQTNLRATGIASMTGFLMIQEQVFWREYKKTTITHEQKFSALFKKQLGYITDLPSSDWAINLTNIPLPNEVKILMGLSPKFSLPHKEIPNKTILHLIAETEDTLRLIPGEENSTKRNIIRCRISQLINGHLSHRNLNAQDKFFIHLETTTKKFLKEHKDIIIIPSDKGNKTVFMWRNDYETKMAAIVSDENIYQKITRDNTLAIETKNNQIVKRLHDGGYIDGITKQCLTTHNSRIPRMYGLPKIHKTGIPLRPIVSCIMSPTYALSKFLNNILKPITNLRGFNVKDSFQFVERIRNIDVPDGYKMISLDVVSLFPNIPRDLALEIINEMWDSINTHTNINNTLFMSIVKFCLETSYFTYDGQCYSQIDGMPMGGPLSPIIADIVMDYAISKILTKIPENIICLTKYVDDIFCLVPEDKIGDILCAFNNFHNKLQFTVEVEREGGLAYLDTYILRTNNKLETLWYKKAIASDRMLNYMSKHPLNQKISTAIGYIKRVQNLTTTDNYNIKNTIFCRLRMNGFPSSLINSLWNIHSTPHHTNTQIPNSTPGSINTIYRTITYIPKLSDLIRQIIETEISDVKIAFKSSNNISKMLSNTKQNIDPWMESGVVYSIPCECGKRYIGKTIQRLKDRVSQHKRSTRHHAMLNQEHDVTALVTHTKQHGHQFMFDQTEIIDKCPQNKKLEILESLHIYLTKNENVNKKLDYQGISSTYAALLQRVKMRGDTDRRAEETYYSCDEN